MSTASKVPFYILGFLLRSGPLHGYQLKIRLEVEASDFSQIKMSNLYYHLGVLRDKGWIKSKIEKDEKHPDREVYSITSNGEKAFEGLLEEYLASKVMFDFPLDGALFFLGQISPEAFRKGLEEQQSNIKKSLDRIKKHRSDTLDNIPVPFRSLAELIFMHHETHFQCEQQWLQQVSTVINQLDVTSKQIDKE
jgi:DNA-binding PadR family transcriptional regulator